MSYAPITSIDLNTRVQLGSTPESMTLEFKSGYAWRGPTKLPDHAAEVARDVAQFANTDGGSVLVGVAEEERPDGTTVAKEIVGVDDVDGFIAWVEQAIRNHLTPSTFRHPIERIETPAGTVVAINVPPHPQLVAFWPPSSRGIEYLHRTNHGKSWMNPDEAEALMGNELRAVQINAKRIFMECSHRRSDDPCALRLELVPPVQQHANSAGITVPLLGAITSLVAVDDHSVRVKIFNVPLKIPYALVRAVWRNDNGEPALCLKGCIVKHPDRDDFYLDIH